VHPPPPTALCAQHLPSTLHHVTCQNNERARHSPAVHGTIGREFFRRGGCRTEMAALQTPRRSALRNISFKAPPLPTCQTEKKFKRDDSAVVLCDQLTVPPPPLLTAPPPPSTVRPLYGAFSISQIHGHPATFIMQTQSRRCSWRR